MSRILKLAVRLHTVPLSFLMLLFCCIGLAYADGNNSKSNGLLKTTPDFGADTAMVKTQTALFIDPSIDAAKISILHPGDLTVLVSRVTWNGWLRVIQFSSGRQGWVRSDRLFKPVYTNHRAPSVVLPSVSLGTSTPPVIEVKNDSNINLYLHLNKLAEVSVSPHTTKSLTIHAGIFSFNAAGPNVLPDFGDMAFLDGTKYTWRFFIRPAREHTKLSVVTPEMTAEYNRLLADVSVKQAEVKIERGQIDDVKTALDKQGDKVKAETDNIDAIRPMLDHSNEKAVDDFNRLVVSENDDYDTYIKMQEQVNARVDAFNFHLATLNSEQNKLAEIEKTVNASR